MIKKFDEYSINESYKKITNFNKNDFGFDVPVYTYVDKVFDHLVQIICDVHSISEKDFKNFDNNRNYIEMYFDNNPEILLDIDQYNQTKARHQLCAEHLYNKYFQNNGNILESIKQNIKKEVK